MSAVIGPFGTGFSIPIPTDMPAAAETVCLWLIDAPSYHPLWAQYALLVVRLRDGIPGFPPPTRQFPGASHELCVLAVDPTGGRTSIRDAVDRIRIGGQPVPFLMGPNVVQQHEATDDEMTRLAELCVHGVVDGKLNPETGDAPTRIREDWLASATKTLAHFRGEEHAP